MSMLARVKPYNKRRGQLVRRITIGHVRYDESRGWYAVSNDVAERLRDVRVNNSDLESPLVFDVATRSEAEALMEQERMAREKASPSNPNKIGVVTRADLPRLSDDEKESKPSTEPAEEKKPSEPVRRTRRGRPASESDPLDEA